MDIAKFNSVFSDARRRQRTEPDFDVTTAQAELRDLIADEPDADERDWALRMIDRLAEPLPGPHSGASSTRKRAGSTQPPSTPAARPNNSSPPSKKPGAKSGRSPTERQTRRKPTSEP